MVNLRILRGPLSDGQNQAILNQYNRLTAANIPMNEFLHWIQDGPAGPAWHALLETEDTEIVGHTSLIPLRTVYRGTAITPAKSEYSFIREEFRSVKIRGFEKTARPKFLILVDQLFRHCAALGWGPFLISTTPALHKLGPRVQCYPVDFSLRECLLILKPWAASQRTPNLGTSQRVALLLAGGVQNILWHAISAASNHRNSVRSVPLSSKAVEEDPDLLSFFEDEEFLRWRYLEGQYERLAFEERPLDHAIVKKGSADRYLRVCQWNFTGVESVIPLVRSMIRMARGEKALGIRWAVYGNELSARQLVTRLRWLGFLCVSRTRTELIHSVNQELRAAAAWKMNDAMFSFDP